MKEQRPIKFRAFVDDHFVYIDLDQIGNKEAELLRDTLSKPVWGQYTGLKDKNGVEIWEGDVLRVGMFQPEIWEVTFDRGGFCLRDKPDAQYYPDIKYGEDAEVIGNVYESPELLKVKS